MPPMMGCDTKDEPESISRARASQADEKNIWPSKPCGRTSSLRTSAFLFLDIGSRCASPFCRRVSWCMASNAYWHSLLSKGCRRRIAGEFLSSLRMNLNTATQCLPSVFGLLSVSNSSHWRICAVNIKSAVPATSTATHRRSSTPFKSFRSSLGAAWLPQISAANSDSFNRDPSRSSMRFMILGKGSTTKVSSMSPVLRSVLRAAGRSAGRVRLYRRRLWRNSTNLTHCRMAPGFSFPPKLGSTDWLKSWETSLQAMSMAFSADGSSTSPRDSHVMRQSARLEAWAICARGWTAKGQSTGHKVAIWPPKFCCPSKNRAQHPLATASCTWKDLGCASRVALIWGITFRVQACFSWRSSFECWCLWVATTKQHRQRTDKAATKGQVEALDATTLFTTASLTKALSTSIGKWRSSAARSADAARNAREGLPALLCDKLAAIAWAKDASPPSAVPEKWAENSSSKLSRTAGKATPSSFEDRRSVHRILVAMACWCSSLTAACLYSPFNTFEL